VTSDRAPTSARPRSTGARLTDVAARAGVSVKTVSNVVNGYVHVSPTTRARVGAALAELGYRPNAAARNLRKGRSGIVALSVPELEVPYFAELARHVVEAARSHGLTVLIDQTDGELERERLAMDGFGTQLIDGLVLSPIASGARELAARRDPTPMVLLGERVYDGPEDHVSIDNVAAANAAVTHLLALGRTRVAAVGKQQTPTASTAQLRTQGYRSALQAAGLPTDPELLVAADAFTRSCGAAAADTLLNLPARPDAVFCFNDLLALGLMRRLHERGVRVPDEVAVVGIDDIEDGRYSTPTLTTIRPNKAQIAQLAVQLLADRLKDRDGTGSAPPRELTASFDLVIRESSGSRTAS
jgi:DNA-binding LacI/PurR family transcriptional regulator